MKLKKAKRFNTVESYASCICQWSTCSCNCTCYCLCTGVDQPQARSAQNTLEDASNSLSSRTWMDNTSAQRLQM